jgi:hypothetical protein
MLALSGPISMTCVQISAMKRPSDVPPLVDSSAWYAGLGANRLQRRVDQRAVAGQEGLAARAFHAELVAPARGGPAARRFSPAAPRARWPFQSGN